MPDKISEKPELQVLYSQRTKRRYLPSVIRYLIIGLGGITLSFLVVYLLRKVGY